MLDYHNRKYIINIRVQNKLHLFLFVNSSSSSERDATLSNSSSEDESDAECLLVVAAVVFEEIGVGVLRGSCKYGEPIYETTTKPGAGERSELKNQPILR